MTESILISENQTAISELVTSVNKVIKDSQDLCDAFTAFMDQSIITEAEFMKLAEDPAAYFDAAMIEAVGIKKGKKQLDPDQVAKMYGYDRDNWLNLIAGRQTRDCHLCDKLKYKRGSHPVRLSTYNSYKPYITFSEGQFSVNQETIEAKKESLKVRAITPAQIAIYDYWTGACTTLNSLLADGHIGPMALAEIGKHLSKYVRYSPMEMKLNLNNETISYLIQTTV